MMLFNARVTMLQKTCETYVIAASKEEATEILEGLGLKVFSIVYMGPVTDLSAPPCVLKEWVSKLQEKGYG